MKTRSDFVTNSSSVCYVCQISGDDASGHDIGLEEVGMLECREGHVFKEEYALRERKVPTFEEVKEELLKKQDGAEDEWLLNRIEKDLKRMNEIEEDWEKKRIALDVAQNWGFGEQTYEVPPEICPICQMEFILGDDVKMYLLKKYKLSEEEVEDEMRKKYSSYKEMEKNLYE